MASAHSLHLPHVPERFRPRPKSARSGYSLFIAFVVSITAWAFALVQLGRLRTGGSATTADYAVWVAVACAAVLTMFMLIVWKAFRAANS